MKKLIFWLLPFLLVFGCEKEWDEMEHLYYHGDIEITDLAHIYEVEETLSLGYNAIDGNLIIRGDFNPRKFKFLNEIYEITGTLIIEKLNPIGIFRNLRIVNTIDIFEVSEIDDFNSLIECSIIEIRGNLSKFTGFSQLIGCDDIAIGGLVGFDEYIAHSVLFSAFPKIEYIDELLISLGQNPDDSFNGFQNLLRAEMVRLSGIGKDAFPNLTNVTRDLRIIDWIGDNCLTSLDTIIGLHLGDLNEGSINIGENEIICARIDIHSSNIFVDFQDISNIYIYDEILIYDNINLESLAGLNIANTVDDVDISYNENLNNFCIFSGMTFDYFYAGYNEFNPTRVDIQNGNCSQ
jgi:hypothetical protein